MVTISEHDFSKAKNGEDIRLFRMENGTVSVDIITLGGIISSISMPDKNGKMDNICLGFSSPSGYEEQTAYIGAMLGRYANRIGNASFSLNGKEYHLTANDGKNQLHGGPNGFDKKIWKGRVEKNSVILSLHSPDGEEGYPGNMDAEVKCSLSEGNELSIEYSAVCDQDTVCNLANHTYLNLNGRGKGDILRHYLKVNADQITRTDSGLIPTGEFVNVENTPFDFHNFHQVGERISEPSKDLEAGGGYDQNFAVNGKGFREAAVLKETYTGRQVTILTDMPGIQVYSGNYLHVATKTKKGSRFGKYSGIALETQHYPDTPNHPDFPSSLLKAGEKYYSKTVYRFEVIK